MEIQNHGFWELILTAFSVSFTFLLGHNFWLTAKDEADEIKIELITSDKFPESDSAVKRERIADFRVFGEKEARQIEDYQTSENLLFARIKKSELANFAAIELYPHPIVLEAEKFGGYIGSEEAEKFVAPQFIKGETLAPQRESYAKFAKVLINNDSFQEIAGHKLEIVLQNNPSEIETGEKLKLKVIFDGEPVENLRVSSGAENIGGGKYLAHARTDKNGFAEIEIAKNHLCFIRTHLIRQHQDSESFDWESFWASLTFYA